MKRIDRGREFLGVSCGSIWFFRFIVFEVVNYE